MTSILTPPVASKFARLALAHVMREYPNKLDHVINGPVDVKSPRELHPVRGTFELHLHPDDREGTLAMLRAHFEERIPYDVEYRLRTKSGEYRWFHARGQASWDESGAPARA